MAEKPSFFNHSDIVAKEGENEGNLMHKVGRFLFER